MDEGVEPAALKDSNLYQLHQYHDDTCMSCKHHLPVDIPIPDPYHRGTKPILISDCL